MSLEHLTQRKVGNPSANGISTPDDLSVSSSNFTDRDGTDPVLLSLLFIDSNWENRGTDFDSPLKFNFKISFKINNPHT